MSAELTPIEPAMNPAPPASLRVAFDLRTWAMSGLGTYVRELLGAFSRLGAPIDWTFIGPEALREQLPPNLAIAAWHDFDAPLYGPRGFFGYPALRGVELFHYPHYNLPLTRARRRLVNVFDLFHLHYGSLGRRLYQRNLLRRLRWGRAHVLTASDKVQREVRAVGKILPERLSMIPLGPGRSLPQRPGPRPPTLRSLADTPLAPPWFLALGIDKPHKNFDFLLSALNLYYQRRPEAPPLVWVGIREEEIARRIRLLPAPIRARLALVPPVDAESFETLFSGATALLFPSLDEGFGLPPLEAMARGVPVLCSRREPMTAILADAPLYFEPTESASLWRTLDRLLDSRDVWHEVSDRGRQLARRYSWDTTARETFRLYRRIIGPGVKTEER